MRRWLSSGLPGMSSLDVLFFACHRLDSMTLQPSKVDGLVDAVCGLPCGIYALLQYLPIFLSQFSAELRLLRGADVTCKILRRHRWRKTFNFCAIFVVIFHVSLAYIPTDITLALYNHIFVSMLIIDNDHIDRMRWNTEAALPILQLTSASASASAGILNE